MTQYRASLDLEKELMLAPIRMIPSGILVDLARPRPEDVNAKDIAHHTAGIYRWTGGSRFTVAQHNVLVYRLSGGEPWALLHDTTEAYVGDVSHPLKRLLGDAYRDVEHGWSDAISRHFCIAQTDVTFADQMTAQLEANYNWPEQGIWVYAPEFLPLSEFYDPIVPWPSDAAEAVWLSEMRKLGLA